MHVSATDQKPASMFIIMQVTKICKQKQVEILVRMYREREICGIFGPKIRLCVGKQSIPGPQQKNFGKGHNSV